jgi:hypothetical protein
MVSNASHLTHAMTAMYPQVAIACGKAEPTPLYVLVHTRWLNAFELSNLPQADAHV